MEKSNRFGITSAILHIIAMTFMLFDHMWATLFPAAEWMTLAGRIAFPIFAFMASEGYFHTHDFKKYLMRMLVCAVISEVPFDLMYGGTCIYPVHQNVIWTLILGLLGIHLLETIRKKCKIWIYFVVSMASVILGVLLGTLFMVDYYGAGVVTVLVFYFFRKHNWYNLLLQAAALYIINVEMLGGLMFPISLFGHEFEICEQGAALLALIPIWLYNGKRGYKAKWFQYFCYGFYPAHMLVLYIILNVVTR